MTPFWTAAALGYRDSMKTLLAAGATCDLTMGDAIGLMELAFRYDMPEAVELALDQCLDANFLFYDKYPSTWAADYYEADEIQDLLIEHGAENRKDADLGIVSLKDLSEKPKVLESTSIYYPQDLKRKYGSRNFLIQVIIDDQGKLLFPKMINSEVPEINRIVMETITNWRFSPPMGPMGEPCSVIAKLPIALDCGDVEKSTYMMSEVDQPPKVLKAFPPRYPGELKMQNIQGRVVLNIIIDETGKPEQIGIESLTHRGFAEAAIAAGKQYEFRPAYYQGKPVKVIVKLPVVFELN
jgi:TonB family protein